MAAASNDDLPDRAWVPPEVRERLAREAINTAARTLVDAQRLAEEAGWSPDLTTDLHKAWEMVEYWRREVG